MQASRRQEPVFGLLKRDAEVRVILPPNCSERHLLGAILDNLDNVELDSIVYSDGWKADNKHSLNGFHHKRIIHEKTLANGKGPINGPESSRGYAKSLPRRFQAQLQTLYPRKADQNQPSRRRKRAELPQEHTSRSFIIR